MTEKIPFMRLDRQFAEHRSEFMDAVEGVFTHGRVLQGQEVTDLEGRVAGLFGLGRCACVGSGTDALVLAMKALCIKPGVKVAVTDLSFVASASAIVLAGGIPVFVDVEPDTGLCRSDVLVKLLKSGEVGGVVAVHLYGQMMELSEVFAAADEAGAFVIEDAAQVLGATRRGMGPGRHSHATCVSFDPTKVIGAQGSGGAVLTDDPEIDERIKRLRYHGHAGERRYSEIGHNSQLPTVQAALINVKLNHEADWRARRIEIAGQFTETLNGIDAIAAPLVLPDNSHIFHKYVMRVDGDRDGLAAFLKERGVVTAVHYSLPLHRQPCFAGCHETAGTLAGSVKLTNEVLSLPIYPELTDAEVSRICRALKEWRR
ncbi:transcriptional regulator [Pseudodesulfovibrio sp. F-1]|uniref:Transcriptional regulator n=1 Tax=Pseudodesulfovibrio alkaliphilus TaxID=2661613 RepID=A0A7K1KMS2_9BACT|nr:transcriptional regulator [Pseudodesulfovibrio alkaliphilus]